MAKKIIVLDRVGYPSDESYNYVLWATVPAARAVAYADPNKTSAYKGATPEEIAALQDGTVAERSGTALYATGTSATFNQDLIKRFNDFQAEISAANPTNRYGTSWDGTTWTSGGTP